MRSGEEGKVSFAQAAKQTVKRELAILIKKIIATVIPGFLGLFSVIALCGIAVVAVLAIIYNSPFAIFFPLPDSGTEDPRTVLVSYYQEFNEKVFDLEEDGETDIFRLVTSIRGDVLNNMISIESPLGKAILGHREGDRVFVETAPGNGYYVILKKIIKTNDDSADQIRKF